MNRPIVILVNPQMGENIGAAARAMKNFGLRELRLVEPRDGWPNPAAESMAKGAEDIISAVQVFSSLQDAIADCQHVYATSGQLKSMPKAVYTPRQAAEAMQPPLNAHQRVALLFGRERTGLTVEEAALARAIVTIPTHPDHYSLNLAQAVVICAYEHWLQLMDEKSSLPIVPEAAPMMEIEGFFMHLERDLEATGFFKTAELRPTMVRNLRSLFLKAQLTSQEVRTLRGVVRSLSRR